MPIRGWRVVSIGSRNSWVFLCLAQKNTALGMPFYMGVGVAGDVFGPTKNRYLSSAFSLQLAFWMSEWCTGCVQNATQKTWRWSNAPFVQFCFETPMVGYPQLFDTQQRLIHVPLLGFKIWCHAECGKFSQVSLKIWMLWVRDFYRWNGDFMPWFQFPCGRSKIGKPWICHRSSSGSFGSPAGRGVVPPKPQKRRVGAASKKAENFNLWSWLMSVNRENKWKWYVKLYEPLYCGEPSLKRFCVPCLFLGCAASRSKFWGSMFWSLTNDKWLSIPVAKFATKHGRVRTLRKTTVLVLLRSPAIHDAATARWAEPENLRQVGSWW